MIQCSLCRKHVHSSCDPEATEEKILERRASQYNYMYVCKVCKGNGQVKGPGAMAGNSMAAPLSRAYDDPSPVEVIEDTPPGPAAAGAGRGKPLNSVAEARKKLLTGSTSWHWPRCNSLGRQLILGSRLTSSTDCRRYVLCVSAIHP